MLKSSTRAIATYEDTRLLKRRRAVLLGCAASFAVLAFSLPAAAQVPAPVTVSNVVTGSTVLSGTQNGANGAGYFVASGGTLTVNNGLMQNFTTSGGAGSGGGLGAGGGLLHEPRG